MLTSKERSALKRLAQTRKPSFQIGKEGLTEAVMTQIKAHLKKNELGKVTVLNNTPDHMGRILQALQNEAIEVVQQVGNVLTIYQKNPSLTRGIDLP